MGNMKKAFRTWTDNTYTTDFPKLEELERKLLEEGASLDTLAMFQEESMKTAFRAGYRYGRESIREKILKALGATRV